LISCHLVDELRRRELVPDRRAGSGGSAARSTRRDELAIRASSKTSRVFAVTDPAEHLSEAPPRGCPLNGK
jgi:hypothetical protein